jgi:flagellin
MVVSNQVSAVVTASLIQSYRNELITYRANLGATSSRIDAYLSALSDAKLSVSEASSRMTDADIATEGAQLAATRIRQQVGASLLAQANLEPQLVLELLRVMK